MKIGRALLFSSGTVGLGRANNPERLSTADPSKPS